MNGRDNPSPEQRAAPGTPRACEQGSPSLLAPPWPGWLPYGCCSPPRDPFLGRGCFCTAEVPTGFAGSLGRRAPSTACTVLPAPKDTLLLAQPHVPGWAKRFPWVERFPLHPRAQSPHHKEAWALWTRTGFCWEGGKVPSGLDSKYTDTKNTQNGEENTQNTQKNQNGVESACHGPFCISLIKKPL